MTSVLVSSRQCLSILFMKDKLTNSRMLPGVKQTLLFSATFPEAVMRYAMQFSPNANSIQLKRDELTVKGISQMYMDCSGDEGKYNFLSQLYGAMTVGSSIIFVKVWLYYTKCVSYTYLSIATNHCGSNRRPFDQRWPSCRRSSWCVRWCRPR